MFKKMICIFEILFFTFIVMSRECVSIQEKIKMTEIKELTFYSSLMANTRRQPPIKQSTCIGGRVECSSYQPDEVTCYNMGLEEAKLKWNCTANLKKEVEFGEIEINCEGYENSSDPYVLVDSCWLRYKLEYTKKEDENAFLNFVWITGIVVLAVCFLAGMYKCCPRTAVSTKHQKKDPATSKQKLKSNKSLP